VGGGRKEAIGGESGGGNGGITELVAGRLRKKQKNTNNLKKGKMSKDCRRKNGDPIFNRIKNHQKKTIAIDIPSAKKKTYR